MGYITEFKQVAEELGCHILDELLGFKDLRMQEKPVSSIGAGALAWNHESLQFEPNQV